MVPRYFERQLFIPLVCQGHVRLHPGKRALRPHLQLNFYCHFLRSFHPANVSTLGLLGSDDGHTVLRIVIARRKMRHFWRSQLFVWCAFPSDRCALDESMAAASHGCFIISSMLIRCCASRVSIFRSRSMQFALTASSSSGGDASRIRFIVLRRLAHPNGSFPESIANRQTPMLHTSVFVV